MSCELQRGTAGSVLEYRNLCDLHPGRRYGNTNSRSHRSHRNGDGRRQRVLSVRRQCLCGTEQRRVPQRLYPGQSGRVFEHGRVRDLHAVAGDGNGDANRVGLSNRYTNGATEHDPDTGRDPAPVPGSGCLSMCRWAEPAAHAPRVGAVAFRTCDVAGSPSTQTAKRRTA